jgi:hypothetical protein
LIVPDPELEARLARLEPPYRSRGEAQVGRLLDRYGIPFFHEYPTMVLDRGRYRIWHPDFTLPHHGGLIVEYAGMPDRPDYMEGIRHKERVYAANGLRALFLYPDDLRGPGWPESAIRRIVSAEQCGAISRSLQYLTDLPTDS